MSDSPAGLRAAKTRLSALAKATPGLLEGFGKISKLATTDGHFSAADKELMAVAIAVVKGCEDCILFHVDGAKRHGAQESALVEALEVAVEMGGGPAMIYAGKALAAYREL